MYEVGARVTYIRFGEQDYTTETLNALLDSSAVFGRDTVMLKKIAGLRKKSPLHNIARVAGIPVMLLGSILMGSGAAELFKSETAGDGVKLFLIGAGIFTIGYLPYNFEIKDLEVGIGGDWTLEIYREKKEEK